MREGVLLELGSRGGTHPSSVYEYRSMIADHALTTLGEDGDAWEEFASFDVNVLAPERTLLEKVAAIHDAATRTDPTTLLKLGRHFYDIHQLLNSTTVLETLNAMGQDGIAALVEDINTHSEAAGFTWSARPEGGYADSPAFDIDHPSRDAIALGYASAQSLIHGASVSLEEVIAVVLAHRENL